jgi:hypothetical protein
MWFLALMVGVLLLALLRLTTRYEYGPRSARALKLVLAASFVFSILLARYVLWAHLETFYLILAATAITLPIFVLAAAVTVEMLRKRKQSVYDQRLRELRSREQALLLEVETHTRQIRHQLRLREEAETAGEGQGQDLGPQRSKVETWKHEGGAARIRSLKIEEWEKDLRALDTTGLEERRRGLERELDAADPERRAQIEVQIALTHLVTREKESGAAAGESRRLKQDAAESSLQRRSAEVALAAVRAEIAEAQRRLSEFLSKEIHLD